MSDEGLANQVSAVVSSRERAALVATALSEAARRARFSTKRRNGTAVVGFKDRHNERLFKRFHSALFFSCFMIPAAVAAAYYGLIASDQFVTEARFTVRGGMPPSMDRLGGLTGAPTDLIVQDTQVIMNFLQSRAVVEKLNRAVGLEGLYTADAIDWFSRLGRGEPIERVVKYWRSHIDLSVQMPSGIVVFAVRAFAPNDAVRLADAALDAGDALVNRMNDQMVHDAVDIAEKERARALKRLVDTRATLERARNEEGMLSAEEASKALDSLVSDVNGQLLKLQLQYESQRRFVEITAPHMTALAAKITAAQDEVTKLEAQRTGSQSVVATKHQGRILSGSMSKLDYATLENATAEKIYAASLTMLEQSRLASETKLMYINTFVRPVAAEESRHPRRLLMISLISAGGLIVWGFAAALLNLARARLS